MEEFTYFHRVMIFNKLNVDFQMHKIKSYVFKYSLKIFTAFIYYASKVLRKILQHYIFSKKK